MEYKGAVFKIIEDVYAKTCTGFMADAKKSIIKLQLTVKTGLNLGNYTHDSMDKKEDIEKLLAVVRTPEIGLTNYHFNF
jgi:hypothetical protein